MDKLEIKCMNQVRAYKVARPTDEELKCRNCVSPIGCTSYRPYDSRFQLVINKGVVAYRMWGR